MVGPWLWAGPQQLLPSATWGLLSHKGHAKTNCHTVEVMVSHAKGMRGPL